MKRLFLTFLFWTAVAFMFESARHLPAQAQTADVSVKEAFDAARALGTTTGMGSFSH